MPISVGSCSVLCGLQSVTNDARLIDHLAPHHGIRSTVARTWATKIEMQDLNIITINLTGIVDVQDRRSARRRAAAQERQPFLLGCSPSFCGNTEAPVMNRL